MEFSPRYQAAVNTALNTCENRWTTNNQFMRDHYQHIKVQFFGNFCPIFGHQYDCYLVYEKSTNTQLRGYLANRWQRPT